MHAQYNNNLFCFTCHSEAPDPMNTNILTCYWILLASLLGFVLHFCRGSSSLNSEAYFLLVFVGFFAQRFLKTLRRASCLKQQFYKTSIFQRFAQGREILRFQPFFKSASRKLPAQSAQGSLKLNIMLDNSLANL